MALSAAASCGTSSSQAAERSVATVATSATPSTRPIDGERCGRPPEVLDADPAEWKALDEEQLRGTPAEVRLPVDAGTPVGVVAVADGAVVLEQVYEYEATEAGSTDTRADLVLRRLDASGATVWTRLLGTFANRHLSDRGPVLAADDDVLRVLWLRHDGALPGDVYADPASVVLTAVDLDGMVEFEADLSELGDQASSGWIVSALGPGGTAATARIVGDDLVVEAFGPDGERRWTDQIGPPTSGAVPQLAVLGDSEVIAASGGEVLRWDDRGRRRWKLTVEPMSLAPIEPARVGGDAPADVLLSFTADDRTWFCALDPDGRIVLRSVEARPDRVDVQRAWRTDAGIVALVEHMMMGSATSLVAFDEDGGVVHDLLVAAAGDVVRTESSTVHDAAATEAGDVLLASVITARTDGPGALETWSALIRLRAPAGLGDLSGVPVTD